MAPNPPRRRVLIIEDEPSIRNILYVLLAGLGYDGDTACDFKQALAMIRQDQFDAVLLDLRASELPPEQMVCAITELRPSLVGRVLVISGEVSSPATLKMLDVMRCRTFPAAGSPPTSHAASLRWTASLPSFSRKGNLRLLALSQAVFDLLYGGINPPALIRPCRLAR